MIPCLSCGCHFRLADPECPHCRAPARGVPRTAAAVLLGLAIGCTGKDAATTDTGGATDETVDGYTDPAVLYGPVTTTDYTDDAPDTTMDDYADYADADTDTDADTDSGTDTDSGGTGGSGTVTSGSGYVIEPLYGPVTSGGSGR